jgi:aspartate racemase
MRKLGILGGMGPLASAEFLSTVYRLNITDPEQGAPVCVMISDPSFPDRTEAILRGDSGPLAERLTAALEDLVSLGADPIVIPCVTAHHVLDQIPPPLRQRVISLIDLVIGQILAEPRRLLLLTTNGTRTARIFERDTRWPDVAKWVERPSQEDQETLHAFLYRLKRGDTSGDIGDMVRWLEDLPARYGVEGCIFGCTELHLVYRAMEERGSGEGVLDPLILAARAVPAWLGSPHELSVAG